jgi:hypothetical protein
MTMTTSIRKPARGMRPQAFLSDEKTERTDAESEKTGESRETTGILGDEKEEHTDADEEKTGESRDSTGILGDETQRLSYSILQ